MPGFAIQQIFELPWSNNGRPIMQERFMYQRSELPMQLAQPHESKMVDFLGPRETGQSHAENATQASSTFCIKGYEAAGNVLPHRVLHLQPPPSLDAQCHCNDTISIGRASELGPNPKERTPRPYNLNP